MPIVPGISRWNMRNNSLCKEEAVEKGQEFFDGEQHSHRLRTSYANPFAFLGWAVWLRVCT